MSLEQELIKELEVSAEAEILGVVSGGGVSDAGTGKPDDGNQWTVLITFSGWKPLGGEFRKSEMTVRQLVPEAMLRTLMVAMGPYNVVRIRARWSEINVFSSPQALLTAFICRDDSDSELNAFASELQDPVTFRDSQFGIFTLNRAVDWYEASPDWCGKGIRLTIPAGAPDDTAKSLEVARHLWAEQESWQEKIASCAAEELLGVKNDSWLDEGERQVSRGEFTSRMVLEYISVRSDGSFEFWHDDGDLFWGHLIAVKGNMTDGPIDAGIQG